jgi:hypothetical protein
VPPVVFVRPLVERPEKATVPEEVIPVAAAIAPELLTWNWDDEPTESRAEGDEFPIPTFPCPEGFRRT